MMENESHIYIYINDNQGIIGLDSGLLPVRLPAIT